MTTTINAQTVAPTGLVITTDSNGDLQLQSNGTSVVTITNTYFVGINNTAPTTALSVSGNSYLGNTSVIGTLTLPGNSTSIATILTNAAENINVVSTYANATPTNYYVGSQSVLYYTGSATANWTVNVAFSSTTSLNTAMATGQAVTVTFLVTQGATAYYNNTFKVDNVTVTPKWQGGTTPTSGNVSGIDAYVYTIIKTGASTYTVLAGLTQFK
jgi:hypothetical protein